MYSDFALPLSGLMFTLPCLVAVHVLEDRKDRFAHLIVADPGRKVLLGTPAEIAMARMGLAAQRTVAVTA